MIAPITMVKRAAAGTLALVVCFTGGVIGAGAASAAPGFTFDQRISGPDRTATAIAASRFQFDDGSDTVVIVERDAVVDGLTASYIAGTSSAPILYVDRRGVPDRVAAEIRRLGATRAILVGGTAVLPEAVATQLESSNLTVTRRSGPDRYATAAAVALSGSRTPDAVIVASGEVPADALVAGPVAYAKGYPLVLTRPDSVPDSTRSALDQLGSGERLVIGGTVRISASTFDSLGDSKRRIAGANRQLTAIALADVATGELGFATDRVALVSDADRGAADALVAAPVAGSTLAPLLFISGTSLGPDTTEYLQDRAAQLTGPGYVFGGTAAVPQSAADQGTTAAGGGDPAPPSTIGFDITPNDAKTLVIASPDDATDDRTYRVGGLDDGTTYSITLVDARDVTIAADGTVTFRSSADPASASGFSADTGTVTTDITVVNGSPTGASAADDVTAVSAEPVGGDVSFTIDGDAPESVIPVVHVRGGTGQNADQGGPSPRLETRATAAGQFAEGAEKFGLGGAATFVLVEAASGPVGDNTTPVNIDSVNKAGYFITAAGTYFYDDNDQFRIAGAPVTLATFAASLSTGDGLRASVYADEPELQSTFDIADRTPSAVTGVMAAAVDDTSIKVTWTSPTVSATNPAPSTHTVYRKAGTTQSAVLTDYTRVTTLSGTTSPTEYTDTGLSASTGYTYAVTQTVDGDESALAAVTGDGTDSVATASTSAPGVTAAPQSVNAGVTRDNGFAGTVSAGDVHTIAFNRPINALPAGAVIRLQDAGGESVDLSNGGAAAFSRNPAPVTFGGRRYPASTVLTVPVGTVSDVVDRDGSTSNNNGSVDYPVTIVAQSGGITADVNGTTVAWNPATSADNVLQVGATAPTADAADTTPPQIVDAIAAENGPGPDTITVVYDEDVSAAGVVGSPFAYDRDAGPPGDPVNGGYSSTPVAFPSSVTQPSSNTVLLTFADGALGGTDVPSDDLDDRVIHFQSGVLAERIRDTAGNDALSPEGELID